MRRSCIALLLATMAAGAMAQDDPIRKMTDDARASALDLLGQVRGELTRALEFSGPLRAMQICKYSVPEISSSISRRTGWRLTRVSLRPRNQALGAPDAWEQGVLMDFEKRLERGDKADEMEFAQVVNEPNGRFFRYMKALPTGPLCVSCHGPVAGLSDAVRSLLAQEYPHDVATGFKPGSLRGAVTVKRPLTSP